MSAGHIAPVMTPDQARQMLCPLLSTLNPDKTLHRVNCQAGDCALWDWLIKPYAPTGCVGQGKCSLPRRAYMAARREGQKVKQATR